MEAPKKKVSRSASVRDIMNWKFEEVDLSPAWKDLLGELPDVFTIYVEGDGGHGKTELMIQMAKEFANKIGKTRLNNVEQGKHKQIKMSIVRNNFKEEVPAGKFQYDSILDFEKYKQRLARPNSGKVQMIDSISFWPLNAKQVQELIEEFSKKRKKCFVFSGYAAHSAQNKPIKHLCDIKIYVKDFVAEATGRYGGGKAYMIWEARAKKLKSNGQLSLV